MTYDEEAEVAQRVLQEIAHPGAPAGTRGAQVQVAGNGYSVHRFGNELRLHQRTGLGHREIGRFLTVAIGEHAGGWMVARTTRPPGEYHDERAAEAARRLVERALVRLGYDVGTTGLEGRRKTARELEADVRDFLGQPAVASQVVRRSARRARRR